MPEVPFSLRALLGGGGDESGAIRQLFLWGVVLGIVQNATQPLQRDLQYLTSSIDPNIVTSPQELADQVVRNIAGKDAAAEEAKKSGVGEDVFTRMVEGAGEPPALQQVLEWWRRGFIEWGTGAPGEPTVSTAIRTSRVYDYWEDAIRKAQLTPPSVGDAVNAVLRNQVDRATGIALAYFAGLGVSAMELPPGADSSATEAAFDLLVHTAGNPPSLTELLELARRKIIPWGNLDPATATPDPTATTFAQGIFEGDAKDKWLPFYAELGRYLPPPRTIVTLLRDGVITTDQATGLFTAQGLTPDLAASYVASATSEKVATHKSLAVATVEDLYFAHMIDSPTATGLIENLGYDAQETGFILALVDMRRSLAAVNSAITRVGNYYVAHKIDHSTAQSMLGSLGVPPEQIAELVTTWDITRTANIRLLTEAQIADAFYYKILDQPGAMAELEALGYTPHDAWTVLSVKVKAPLPDEPAPGPAGIA